MIEWYQCLPSDFLGFVTNQMFFFVVVAMVTQKSSLLDEKADKNQSNNDELFAKAVKWKFYIDVNNNWMIA